MTEFEFATAQRIVFGAGKLTILPQIITELVPLKTGEPRRILFVTGKSEDRVKKAVVALAAAEPQRELQHAILNVPSEPSAEEAVAGVALAHQISAHLVIAIGGGSAIDCAKAVAMLVTNGGEPLDYMEVIGRGKKISLPSLPMIAVPTTAGTGSEVTRNSVLLARAQRVKVSLRSLSMLPRVALVDPALALSVPRDVTAATGLDALTQCLEPYLSINSTPITDALAIDGLRLGSRSLRRVCQDGNDLLARTDMALCSLYGGLALANAKLGAVHGFAGVLGGMYAAPHGMLCAALLAPVFDANVAALRARLPKSPLLEKHSRAAQVLTGSPSADPEAGAQWLSELCKELGVPRLREYGVQVEHVDEVVRKAAQASSMKGNCIELTYNELSEILKASL
jgi:alcohol dehydrogenase class IV